MIGLDDLRDSFILKVSIMQILRGPSIGLRQPYGMKEALASFQGREPVKSTLFGISVHHWPCLF